MERLVSLQWVFIFASVLAPVGVVAAATDSPIPPLCTDAMTRLSSQSQALIRAQDDAFRNFLVREALGPEGLATLERVVGTDPMLPVQSLADALGLVRRSFDEPQFYQPILGVVDRLSKEQAWALYLNSGFHAGSTHTNEHRDMVSYTAEILDTATHGDPSAAVVDWGLGNGNMAVANMLRNDNRTIWGVDVAGSGLNVGAHRLSQIGDLLAAERGSHDIEHQGRFVLARGSLTDPTLLPRNRFSGGSMILSLFPVEKHRQQPGLTAAAQALKEGADFVFMDPAAQLTSDHDGQKFIKKVVESAYRNNPQLTYADVAILGVLNAHRFLPASASTKFPEVSDHHNRLGQAGFEVLSSEPAYFGIGNIVHARKRTDALSNRVSSSGIDLQEKAASLGVQKEFGNDRNATEIEAFVVNQRTQAGIAVPSRKPEDTQHLDADLSVERFDEIYGGRTGTLLILRSPGGKVMATAGIATVEAGIGELRKIYVDPTLQGQGVGGRLLRHTVDRARVMGIHTLRLEAVRSAQAARALYIRHGFEEVPSPVTHSGAEFRMELRLGD